MIKVYDFIEKSSEVAKEKMLYELGVSEKEIYYKETEETSGGLFKSKKIKIEALKKEEIIEYAKETLNKIFEKMGIEVKIEAKKRDEVIKINLFSNNNSILIGKNGKTIDSLQTILKSSIYNKTNFKINILIDVEDYREKQQRNIERTIKNMAFEVKKTGIPISLDPMNSYERRNVHSICSSVAGVTTESVGEEPDRYIIIKRKE